MSKSISSPAGQLPVPGELIERRIYLIRGQKVMLDADMAERYQVLTKNLNLAVRRNTDRFPEDFMFQLTTEEAESLRLQFATSKGRPRWPALSAICFHRARRGHALVRAPQSACRSNEHSHHPGLYKTVRSWQRTKTWPVKSTNWRPSRDS